MAIELVNGVMHLDAKDVHEKVHALNAILQSCRKVLKRKAVFIKEGEQRPLERIHACDISPGTVVNASNNLVQYVIVIPSPKGYDFDLTQLPPNLHQPLYQTFELTLQNWESEDTETEAAEERQRIHIERRHWERPF